MKEIFESKQPQIVYCDSGRAFVYVNEREVKVMESTQPDMELQEVTKYEYDVIKVTPKAKDEVSVLAELRSLKYAEIDAYDTSDNVNNFSFKGVGMWLNKETRNGLLMRLNAEDNAGKKKTTLWLGTQSFELTVKEGIQLLYSLELYASECFDNTAAHKAAVEELTDAEEIYNYDFTTGYPPMLVF